ncbi:ATPase [Halosegnis marinus]|uniref:ATPase n=1 Tax=Halosegnis marinus TaxID=3034023 RepID=A0ABD5ZRH4_9EURY|nr:ATPase [Halosegnis sp. DT85]
MRLLVAGGDRVDAGKTTFSVGLCHETGARGYKPRAGNDFWFDHDDYERAVADGRLYGKDAKRLADASPGDVAPEDINPVHRLWTPMPGRGTGVLGQDGRQFVCDRVRVGDGAPEGVATTDAGDAYVVNATVETPDSAAGALPLDAAERVDSLPAFNDLMARLHGPATDRVAAEIAAADRAVVESYADIARPLPDMEADAVAVVEPRRCRVFDGERYLKACDVASGSAREGRLEERVGNVVELIEPAATAELPALSGGERADPASVADAYGPAYEALFSVAF